jgi:hypothetical protein
LCFNVSVYLRWLLSGIVLLNQRVSK